MRSKCPQWGITLIALCMSMQGVLFAQQIPRSGFFTEAALLYWQAQEGGLSDVVRCTSKRSSISPSQVQNPHFEWDIGFQLGLGYRIPHDLWEASIRFTALQTHSDHSTQASPDEILLPVFAIPREIEGFVRSARTHWRVHLGLVDGLLSTSFHVGSTVVLRPQVGISTGWIRQKYNVQYTNGHPSKEEDLIRAKNKFWGIGPLGGVKMQWNWTQAWGLYGEGTIRLLYGEFYVHQDEDLLTSKKPLLGIHNLYWQSVPVVEMVVGVKWQHFFSSGLKRLQLLLGWDQMLLFSQNQLMYFTSTENRGQFLSKQSSLSLSGIQCSFRLDF